MKYRNHSLSLHFKSNDFYFDPFILENKNIFLLPDTLTQDVKLQLQISLENESEKTFSNIIYFYLRPSLNKQNENCNQSKNEISNIKQNAVTSIDCNENSLYLYNFFNNLIQRTPLPTTELRLGNVITKDVPGNQKADVQIGLNNQQIDFTFFIPHSMSDAAIAEHEKSANAHACLLATKATCNSLLQANLNSEFHNGWKIINGIEELGIIPGQETLESFFDLMPEKSVLYYFSDSPGNCFPADAPGGLIKVEKLSSRSSDTALFCWSSSGGFWFGTMTTEKFRGWQRLDCTSGTWSPLLVDSAGNEVLLSTSAGTWSRSGDNMTVTAEITVEKWDTVGNGFLFIQLPTALTRKAYAGGANSIGTLRITGASPSSDYAGGFVAFMTSGTQIRLDYNSTSTTVKGVTSSWLNTGTSIRITISYLSA